MSIRLFALMGIMPVLAADLKTLQKAYQADSAKILQSSNPQFSDLQQQYKKALETLKTVVQNQGDLVKTKAVIAEIERFQKEKSQPAAVNESEIQEIKTFQSSYVKQYVKLETDLTIKLGALTVKYEQDLDCLQKDMVKAGKLDEATAVQAERDLQKTAIKGYADQLAALRDSAATNETRGASATVPSVRSARGVSRGSATKQDLYLVVDLKGGTNAKNYPVSYLASEPKGGWTDEYKTVKLVLRKIEPGTFIMGSPEKEAGRQKDESQHQVTLSKAFFIGIFEVTQRQWELVMGSNPSSFKDNADLCPVEQVSFVDIRKSGDGVSWPTHNRVDATSFMGKMRARTGAVFDLPTEAQWEYACRAGTIDAFAMKGDVDNLAWYKDNANGKTHPVGLKVANACGLYDMHGNVGEWCLDWHGAYSGAESDPCGAASGSGRMIRGGCWISLANHCRSAARYNRWPHLRNLGIGFRAASTLP
jgi:formylglycine-generating enzyme required for sulfatase activity